MAFSGSVEEALESTTERCRQGGDYVERETGLKKKKWNGEKERKTVEIFSAAPEDVKVKRVSVGT